MEISTKANVGDVIFYLNDNKVKSAPALYIGVHVGKEDVVILNSGTKQLTTKITYKTCHGTFEESRVYLSKEDMSKALMDDQL